MISAHGGLPAHRYTPQVTPRWPRGSEAASQHAWAVVKLGQRHHVMHVEHVRTEERGNETHYLVRYENEEASMEHWVRSKDLFTSEPEAEAAAEQRSAKR